MKKINLQWYYLMLMTASLLILMHGCSDDSADDPIEPGTFTDADGNIYHPVNICDQVWMVENLNVSKFRNGDAIPKVTDDATWYAMTTAAYCYYNNDSTTYAATYGKLYNWYAVNDPRGLAPEGWHIPTDLEWTSLGACLGGDTIAGGLMKDIGTVHWNSPNTGATNDSGFTGLPGSIRYVNGPFGVTGDNGVWWSSSVDDQNRAWVRDLNYFDGILGRKVGFQRFGLSVRCLKD